MRPLDLPVTGILTFPSGESPEEASGGPRYIYRARGARPGLRHGGGARRRPPYGPARGADVLFLLRAVQGTVHRGARGIPERPPSGRARVRREPLHLPDGSRDRAGHAGRLPDLRHGAGADAAGSRCGAIARAARLAPPALACRTARRRRVRAGDGEPRGHSLRLLDRTAALRRAAMPAGDTCALDRARLLPARARVGAQPLPQHVDADRARHRRRLAFQPCGSVRARHLPRSGP